MVSAKILSNKMGKRRGKVGHRSELEGTSEQRIVLG
jgi:hypothetical protein